MILTHAHIDHSGLIPYIYKLGFRGSVVCTPATRDLCSIMLADSAHIQELDAKWFNKKQSRKHLPCISPIYNVVHAERCMELFVTTAYDRRLYIDENISVKFTNTAHMLGSGAANIRIKEGGEVTNICYTGDIGRADNYLLSGWTKLPQCDYLITESTYGNRLHPPMAETGEELLRIVEDTCVRRWGKVIIPSFSVGRTQEIVYTLNRYYNAGRLPRIEVFVDSPLSVNATDIFRLHTDSLNDRVKETMLRDPRPLRLQLAALHHGRERIEGTQQLQAALHHHLRIGHGRGRAHQAPYIQQYRKSQQHHPHGGLLHAHLAGRTPAAAGAGGNLHFRQAAPGQRPHRPHRGFSAHGDYREMIDYLTSSLDPKQIKGIFLVHGEPDALTEYREHLREAGFRRLTIPEVRQEVEL